MYPKFQSPDLEIEDVPTDEVYRILFSNLERKIAERKIKSIAVTSAVKGEGKTTTTIQLAKVTARDFKRRVLLLEGDLNNPQLDSIEIKKANEEQAIGKTVIQGLEVMTLSKITSNKSISGPIFANGLKKIMDAVGGDYDTIFIDCPPVLPLVDMQVISGIVDGIVVVVKAEVTAQGLVAKAMKGLPKEKILGIVLNGIPLKWPNYGIGYGYGYH